MGLRRAHQMGRPRSASSPLQRPPPDAATRRQTRERPARLLQEHGRSFANRAARLVGRKPETIGEAPAEMEWRLAIGAHYTL